jgi:hypothetical protein
MVWLVIIAFLGCWALIVLTLVIHFQKDDHLILFDVVTHVKTNIFFLPVGIVGYPNFITLSCLFLNPSFWKSYGIIISSLIGFFYGLLTRTWFFHVSNKCSFKYHVSTSPILCRSNDGRLVISLSYHICIPFVFGSFSYKLWIHLGLLHPPIDFFHIVNVDIPLMV